MDIILYQNLSPENYLNKNIKQQTAFLNEQMVGPLDDASPEVTINTERTNVKWDRVNYARIDGAYYYVDSVVHQFDGLSVLTCRMDLLMTYAAFIKSLNVHVTRQTQGSVRIADDQRVVSADSALTVIDFPGGVSGAESDGVYVLTTSQTAYA